MLFWKNLDPCQSSAFRFLEHQSSLYALALAYDEAVGFCGIVVRVNYRWGLRIYGSGRDASSRPCLTGHVVGHDRCPIHRILETGFFGAKGSVQDIHLELRTWTLQKRMCIIDCIHRLAFTFRDGSVKRFMGCCNSGQPVRELPLSNNGSANAGEP